MITGYTDNKLDDIISYDPENPYIVGINGVTEVTDEYVKYNTDNLIDYITFFDGQLTTIFSYVPKQNFYNNKTIIYDESFYFNDMNNIESFVNINRNNYSVFEKFFKLNSVKSVGDFNDFPLNYF